MSAQSGKSRTPRSLAATLTASFVTLSIVVLLISSSIQIYSNVRTQQALIAAQQQVVAHQAGDVVAAFFERRFAVLETAAKAGNLVYASGIPKNLLGRLLGMDPAIRQAALLDWRGREMAAVSRVSQTVYGSLVQRAGSDVLSRVQEEGRYISPVYVDEVTHEPMVVLAVPTTNLFGEFQGVLMAEVNLTFLWELISRLRVGETGWAYVVDRQGNLLAFRDISRVLRGENVSGINKVAEFVRTGRADESAGKISRGITGDMVISTYIPMETPDWAVVTELPIVEAYRPAFRSLITASLFVVAIATLAGAAGGYLARRLSAPLRSLTAVAERIAGGELQRQAVREGPAETVRLADAFNYMTAQLRELIGTLEQRVADRTRNLQVAAEVARSATSFLDLDELLRQSVEIIRERFGLYYVGLFLVDAEGRFAVLRAGTGEAGRRMIAQGHRLEVGGQSMIGQCVARGEARIALDVGEEAVRFDNPLLPETRSEMALPLRARGRVIGAMTVQSTKEAAFDEADIAVMQTMADQVAIAIDNARLFAELQSALEAERRAYGEITRQAWADLLRSRVQWGYRWVRNALAPVEGDWEAHMLQAAQTGRSVLGDGAGTPSLAVPVRVRDQVVAVLNFRKGEADGNWTADEIALLETLAEQLGVALESARLYQEAQRRAVQEQIVAEMTARLRASLDPDTVLKTTVYELGRVLGARWTAVEITGPVSDVPPVSTVEETNG